MAFFEEIEIQKLFCAEKADTFPQGMPCMLWITEPWTRTANLELF